MADLWEPVSGVFWKVAPLLPSLENLKNLGESSFFTTVFGALAGAFFGAWAAQRIARLSKVRDELQKEIRDTNAGIAITWTIANTTMALSTQHVKSLKSAYDNDCEQYDKFVHRKNAGEPLRDFIPKYDLRSCPEISTPITTLQDIAFGRLSITGRPLTVVSQLKNFILLLNTSITKRNELVTDFKHEKLPKGAQLYHMYLGVPYEEGSVNQEYGDSVDAIATYTDDVIFFSVLLCEDLRKHGLSLAARYEKILKQKAPHVNEVDYSKPRQDGLVPEDEKYTGWLTGFTPPKPVKKTSRWRFWKNFATQ